MIGILEVNHPPEKFSEKMHKKNQNQWTDRPINHHIYSKIINKFKYLWLTSHQNRNHPARKNNVSAETQCLHTEKPYTQYHNKKHKNSSIYMATRLTPSRSSTYERPFTREGNYLVILRSMGMVFDFSTGLAQFEQTVTRNLLHCLDSQRSIQIHSKLSTVELIQQLLTTQSYEVRWETLEYLLKFGKYKEFICEEDSELEPLSR